ncbi:MAG: hypothetical protein IJ180_01745 [Bacteroidales bacterium]|nr:hypothetical protein [Bacteroidales bacterium]
MIQKVETKIERFSISKDKEKIEQIVNSFISNQGDFSSMGKEDFESVLKGEELVYAKISCSSDSREDLLQEIYEKTMDLRIADNQTCILKIITPEDNPLLTEEVDEIGATVMGEEETNDLIFSYVTDNDLGFDLSVELAFNKTIE